MNRRRTCIYGVVMTGIILFSGVFIALIGYMNFKANYQEIKDAAYGEIAHEFVEQIEDALSFGKSLENYYGMAEVFEQCRKRLGEDIELFVIDTKDNFCYTAFEEERYQQIQQAILHRNFQQAKTQEQGGSIRINHYNYLLNAIENDNEVIGYYVAVYSDQVIEDLLSDVREAVIVQTLICTAVLLLLFFAGSVLLSRLRTVWTKTGRIRHIYPLALILCTLILQSACSLYVYQNSYRDCMIAGADEIMTHLQESISSLVESGVDLKEIDGVSEYLGEKVSQMPILWNIRISDEIANAAEERENTLLKRYSLDGAYLTLEAELSAEYIQDKMTQNVLVLVSTLIIMMILILELMKLPGLSMYLASEKRNRECDESYLQVSNTLRISGFLCGTAEYICVPYAAMMIREWNESVLGLSVGMTAALPLSLECFMQMAAMLILPKVIGKMDIRRALAMFGVSMSAINFAAFFADSAAAIILFRGAAGIAYAGFKQISNYLITRGYHTELERSRNLSQDNAGLLAGVTCGAGLGAIICETAGYSATFLVSAGVFVVYLLLTLFTVPWKWLKQKQSDEKKADKIGVKNLIRMICSKQMLWYIVLIGMPLNIGVQLCVTLIPAICQKEGISTAMLSYCYIVNGIAGIYIGPALVNVVKKKMGICPAIAAAMALTGASLLLLKIPPVAVMLMIASMIFGFLDGFATPLSMDEFMELSVVKKTVTESSALIICVVLSYILMTIAPMIAETMLLETDFFLSPLMIGAIAYFLAAFLLMRAKRKR